jgi:hypothetical protein
MQNDDSELCRRWQLLPAILWAKDSNCWADKATRSRKRTRNCTGSWAVLNLKQYSLYGAYGRRFQSKGEWLTILWLKVVCTMPVKRPNWCARDCVPGSGRRQELSAMWVPILCAGPLFSIPTPPC